MRRAREIKAAYAALAVGALSLTWVAPVAAQDTPPKTDRPRMLQGPTGEDLARVYPDRAQRLEVRGQAGIACVADEAGALTECKVTHEWPKGYGFGEAAVRLSSAFKVSKPGTFRTMIRFELACDDPVNVAPGGRVEDSRVLKVLSCPSGQDQDAVFPGGDVTLRVTLHCWLTADGRLESCVGEGPDTVAATAAARLAPLWRIEPPPPALVHGVATVRVSMTPPDPGASADVH